MEEERNRLLQRNKRLAQDRSELLAKSATAAVPMPTTPPNKTLEALKTMRLERIQTEASTAMNDLERFDDRQSKTVETQAEFVPLVLLHSNYSLLDAHYYDS